MDTGTGGVEYHLVKRGGGGDEEEQEMRRGGVMGGEGKMRNGCAKWGERS